LSLIKYTHEYLHYYLSLNTKNDYNVTGKISNIIWNVSIEKFNLAGLMMFMKLKYLSHVPNYKAMYSIVFEYLRTLILGRINEYKNKR